MIYRNLFAFFAVFSFVLLLTNATKAQLTSVDPVCLPSCEVDDGRFLVISEGNFETFTPGSMNIQIIVQPNATEFSFGVFDGDAPGTDVPDGNWDVGAEPGQFTYDLIMDPDQDNNGPVIFSATQDDFANNDWTDFSFDTDPAALDANGNFVYTLRITLDVFAETFNSFKVRSTGSLSLDEPFGIVANFSGPSDATIIFPNADVTDGIQAEDYSVTTYDGTFCLVFRAPMDLAELIIWDADLDHGNEDGTDPDTDDPNTSNNFIPTFVPPDSDAVLEGVNPSAPFDDRTIMSEADFANFTNRTPSVIYTVHFPDGREFQNLNPTGNREWEQFVISTTDSDPSRVDIMTNQLVPAGLYELCLDGLDMQNQIAFRLPFPYIAEANPIDPEQVPTISEWGLIAMAGVLGIIGLIAVRRRASVSRI